MPETSEALPHLSKAFPHLLLEALPHLSRVCRSVGGQDSCAEADKRSP
jgi:hypothetical protein